MTLNNDCKGNTAVLVLSCDNYCDAWPTFFSFFFKYWGDCPFPIYLGSNTSTFNDSRVISLQSSMISDWGSETLKILEQIREEYIIIILEDYFIYKKVNTDLISEIISYMENHSGVYCRLACMPSKLNSYWEYRDIPENPELGIIEKNQTYRINLQVAIWNKTCLKTLLKEKEDAWGFEVNGSIRSDQYDGNFFCIKEKAGVNQVHGPITYFCTAISRGVWMKDAIKLCQAENIHVDLSKRRTENIAEYLLRKIYIKSPLYLRKYIDFIKHNLLQPIIKV